MTDKLISHPWGAQLTLLINSIRFPISTISMVEIDIIPRFEEIRKRLLSVIGKRPLLVIDFDASSWSANDLLNKARDRIQEVCCNEQELEGVVLCLVDHAEEENMSSISFWQQTNLLRESWASSGCHLIFFLLPASYRSLLREADHLADWIPLKLHIKGDLDESSCMMGQDRSIAAQEFSLGGLYQMPGQAKKQLQVLEMQLSKSIQKEAIDEHSRTVRYYLPMFFAAVQANEFKRAENLRRKIEESDLAERNLVEWWHHNFKLDSFYRHFDEANKWLDKLEEIYKTRGDEQDIATIYHNRGIIAQEQRDFKTAESWYKKSLAIKEKQGNEHGAAITYHQLGRIAEEQRDFKTAESWYKKSLAITEKQGDEYGAAGTYHQLGIIAEEQRDFKTAESWYKKSLAIFDKQGDEHRIAATYHNLGMIAQEQRDFKTAGKRLINAAKGFLKTSDQYHFNIAAKNYAIAIKNANEAGKEILRNAWRDAGLDKLVSIEEIEY